MEYGPVALWLVVFLGLGVVALPLAARLFRGFPDRGATLSIPLSLTVVGVVAYWVGHLSLDAGLVAGLLVLVGLSALSLRDLDRTDFELGRFVGPVVVFAVAFLFVVAIRAVDPAVHPSGGEKFLDFGLLKSLLRTQALPPEDFWFAGEPVQYYYGGHLLTALLMKVTFTPARYAYNLALAGFFGAVVTAAYGLAGAVAAARGRSAPVAGVLAAFFVGFASNLETPGRAVLLVLPDGLARAVATRLDVELAGLAASPGAFSYWDASRVIPGAINEFPLFAWLNGDLHAHMLSTPFLLLAAACWFAYYRTPEAALRRRRLLVFGAVPPIVGLLTVVNTWSFPTSVGVGWLAMTFADSDPRTLIPRVGDRLPTGGSRVEREALRTGVALVVAAVVLVVGIAWSVPFWLDSASGRAIAFLPDRSPLGALLLVHGAFLALFVPYLLDRGRRLLDTATTQAVLVVVLGLVAVAWLADAAALALLAPLLVVGWLVLVHRHDTGRSPSSTAASDRRPTESDGGVRTDADPLPAVGFETVLIVAGVGVLLLVEFVYIQGNAGPGRLNTVFKTYAQVWMLFAVAAGAVGAWLVDAHRPDATAAREALTGRWRLAGRVLVGLVVVLASVYGAFALTAHFTSTESVSQVDDPTIDALAFVSTTHPEEADAIEWLDARPGQPTIVSVPSCYCNDEEALTDYHWVNAPSSLTGVPTVVGWDHEVGYRGETAYFERVDDVRTIYEGTPAQRARLLDEYDVRYIYVGPNERLAYGDVDFSGLDGVSVEKRWDAVTIYRVNQNQLSA
ncbi:DUF2298 domain-containing protein [Halococcus sp. IIIV-5B]|uniref:DUF2298 domain-containing protein n=1 Tax=Halococcus sp. IIIV-5B TaxID=2321230 RepID=UPI000E7477C7|nr:DUF2298 domain-containing protein [Halococcus sp. IIIV-5B]RJS99635.1 hypothetical protein D3261_15605 [Halococcus sp. IIIV-5B]